MVIVIVAFIDISYSIGAYSFDKYLSHVYLTVTFWYFDESLLFVYNKEHYCN